MFKINTSSIFWIRYLKFIQSRANRAVINEYTEVHHIIPVCAGGSNDPENLITLTFREHFIAHQLLAKVGVGDVWHKLRFAFGMMSVFSKSNEHRKTLTSRQYMTSKKVRLDTLSEWVTENPSKLRGTKWFINENGDFFRLSAGDPRIEELSLIPTQSPNFGKNWFTDGTKWFMLSATDSAINELGLVKGAPNKGKSKNISIESKLALANDRAGRLWYNDTIRSYKLKPTDPKICELSLVSGRILSEDGVRRIKEGAAWTRTVQSNIDNSNRQKGKKRYNNGVENFTLFPDSKLIVELSLVPGVILTVEGKEQLSRPRDNSFILGKKWFHDGTCNFRLPECEGVRLGLIRGKLWKKLH